MLKCIFLNRLREEMHMQPKLQASESLSELMHWALLLEENNYALRRGGQTIKEKKRWKDREGTMGKTIREFCRNR